jgi:triacylglycerol lipase
MARVSTATAGHQMRREGEWLAALRASEPATLGQRFSCWWSGADQIVFPSTTAVLPGSEAHGLAGVGHVALVERDEIRDDLLGRLDA